MCIAAACCSLCLVVTVMSYARSVRLNNTRPEGMLALAPKLAQLRSLKRLW